MSKTLTAAGYEVFDVILDPSSDEESRYYDAEEGEELDAAVRRWDPKRQSSVDSVARSKHGHHCQMCAALGADQEHGSPLESVTVVDSLETLSQHVATLSIDGMTCSSCVGAVTKALEEVPQVASANVALVNHSATVWFSSDDPDALIKELVSAVEDAGYDAELVELKTLDSTSQRPANQEKDDSWEATYSIDGMTCSSCSNKVGEVIKESTLR